MSEHELIFKMLVIEYMGWHLPDHYITSGYFDDNVLAMKIYDALKCEE